MTVSPSDKPRLIKSFVVRSGRMTAGQRRGWDEYWTEFGLEPGQDQLNVETLFPVSQPLVFEIGFGMGDSLYEMASERPDLNFLGIEVHRPGVGALLAKAGDSGLKNLRLVCGDAVEFINNVLPDHSIDRLQLYFPDPWHKKRHHKRRLVQPEFIETILPKLVANGVIHMATDWEPYADHMLDVLTQSPGLENQTTGGGFAPKPDFRPSTKFEKRGLKLGHGVWDLLFEKHS